LSIDKNFILLTCKIGLVDDRSINYTRIFNWNNYWWLIDTCLRIFYKSISRYALDTVCWINTIKTVFDTWLTVSILFEWTGYTSETSTICHQDTLIVTLARVIDKDHIWRTNLWGIRWNIVYWRTDIRCSQRVYRCVRVIIWFYVCVLCCNSDTLIHVYIPFSSCHTLLTTCHRRTCQTWTGALKTSVRIFVSTYQTSKTVTAILYTKVITFTYFCDLVISLISRAIDLRLRYCWHCIVS
jgi:hypothetical protein